MPAAAGVSMTSLDSAGSVTRSAMRRLVLARISAETARARPLGGEHEMHAERAAALRDGDQAAHEVGQLVGERGELVDHDHQPGERLAPGARRYAVEVGDAGGGEQPLAPAQLAR